jgi:hypothetical protein
MKEYLEAQIKEKKEEMLKWFKWLINGFFTFLLVSWILFLVLILWWFPHWKDPAIKFLTEGEPISNLIKILLAEIAIFILLMIPPMKKVLEIEKLREQLKQFETEGGFK